MTYNQQYYQDNKERYAEWAKTYREANPEKIREMQRAWRADNEGHTYLDAKSGYVKYIGYTHPAASTSGVTGYHRIILWDKLNGADVPCNWCGKQLYWSKSWPQAGDALVVDHLNGVKDDNGPENLVPSCASCNIKRADRSNLKKHGPCVGPECDRQAKSFYRDSGLAVCTAHYNQLFHNGCMFPVTPNVVVLRNDEGRQCRTCREFKQWSEYYPRTKNVGHQSECKTCMYQRNRKNLAKRQGESA
jgi:hypothetical protein